VGVSALGVGAGGVACAQAAGLVVDKPKHNAIATSWTGRRTCRFKTRLSKKEVQKEMRCSSSARLAAAASGR
jgi:hypothetical protein